MNAQLHTIPGDIATLIADFLTHKQARGAARNTLIAYGADLRHLHQFFADRDITLVQLVSERLLNRWLDDGLMHRNWSLRTAHRKLECARSWLTWCKGEGYITHHPAEAVQVKFRPRQVIAPELEPIKAVIAAIGTRETDDLRDRALLMLLLDAALRASEACSLNAPRDYIDRGECTVNLQSMRVYVRPKGGVDGEVQAVGIEDQTIAALKAWLRVRDRIAGPDEPALFVHGRGTRLTRQDVYSIVRRRGAAVGMPRLHPHLLRHRRVGTVIELLGLKVGKEVARHRSASTTANVYGAHAAEVVRHAVRTMAPLGEIACNA